MLALYKKELSIFFSSFTGYLVIAIFLLINSLFLWIFPGDFNIPDAGYASLDNLFVIAPWVFLFLVPAVTMRLFSDEIRSGTMELLLTRPLSDMHIVLAKFAAGITLVLFSLLPTLLYFISIYLLGARSGNIDTGGTLGSYIGLFFLASVYTAIGVFASSITDNPVVSFLVAALTAFVFYLGFDSLSLLNINNSLSSFIVNLGINEHYKSMSRGVIDSRDVAYFVAVSALFLLVTRTVLQSRKW